jgi:hypothetical protein
MSEQLFKLSPDRDLQCYFYMPSAIAAITNASATGFTLSGTWRQQFDWAVVEWNRDNVFEHPTLRYLPDGNLSGLTLSYDETRIGCIPFESSLYPTVDWPSLRVWADDGNGVEQIYYVSLLENATPIAGTYQAAEATMMLTGTATQGDAICICMPTPTTSGDYPEQHFWYQLGSTGAADTLASAAAQLANIINTQSNGWSASSSGESITLSWLAQRGADGNRISVYGTVSAGATASWLNPVATLSGGTFPDTYRVTLNFSALMGYTQPASISSQTRISIPTTRVRKLRWTWAPDLQAGSFQRSPFAVSITNWAVNGENRAYFVAGPGSRRIEDDQSAVTYSSGAWSKSGPGNYSGSTIHYTNSAGDSCTIAYSETATHDLYAGSRLIADGATISISVDGNPAIAFNLEVPGEDVLVRLPLGSFPPGSHSVTITHSGPNGNYLYFDFLEIAYPTQDLPDLPKQPALALATDWDTYHSQSLPAERTAWMVQKLGFTARVNHYAGALWFYDLILPGHVYNFATITFSGTAPANSASGYLTLSVGPEGGQTSVQHLNLIWDTPATVAQAFANLINNGMTQVWAAANGDQLTVTQRALTPWPGQPDAAPQLLISVSWSQDSSFTGTPASPMLGGGSPGSAYDSTVDTSFVANTGYWRTDFSTTLNRAALDWSLAYFKALAGYGIDVVTSFSTELKNADPNLSAGLAQRRIDGTPVIVSTPAVMTNFSPPVTQFWTAVYQTVAQLQAAAGLVPYLQFGEVQWWYFPWNQGGQESVSMPFYDAYTMEQFQQRYGTPMATINDQFAAPSQYPNETAFLPALIGLHTATIRQAVQSQFPNCRFEVLYPTDTNDTALNQAVNYPANEWTPDKLTSLKTESFEFTSANNLDQAAYSMSVSAAKGFANAQRSHLIGIGNQYSSWMKEMSLAEGEGLNPVVLFALDQYCLVGYPVPPLPPVSCSKRQG